ncbi:PPE family protein [Mycolicibacillus trivialis]|uniref:PPE family domain-containing protein n=2 Tax=Mycolicibacillus trivialis TaxID=1798 RepID=A0A1X2EQH8_9MYCO|nr:PPE family protein [Mycolicibacillus trivialis]ORX08422.1 hypothetical protein AWC30_01965 [Mycolicibacillus trivialis]
MDFDLLPPEINSARMYCGPGSAPLLAASGAWSGLAGELALAAVGFARVVAALVADFWRGPSSLAMSGAAAGYVAWLHQTAEHAEYTAAQARSAAAAYQTAFTMTVPPPLIAANRALLLALIAGNLFGQNSPAIAATEAHYEQMWAQDVTAMNGYAASAAAVTRLTPFASPPPAPGGPASLAAVAGPAASTPGLATYLLQIPSLTSAAASTSSSTFSGFSIATTNHALAVNARRDDAQGIGPFEVGAPWPVSPGPAPAPMTPVARPPVSAALGEASLAGRLSVPPSWTTSVRATPVVPAAIDTAAAPAGAAAFAPAMFGEALLGTLAGRGVSTAAAGRRRPATTSRTPATG